MKILLRKVGKIVALFILLTILQSNQSEENSSLNFEITRLDIDIDIDTDGVSQITDSITIKNISLTDIHRVELEISGEEIWNLRVFDNKDSKLPAHVEQKDDVTYSIGIDVDIKPKEIKIIWIQYYLISDVVVEKSKDLQYIHVSYNFSEYKYLADNKYPLSIRFRAPRGFFMTIDAEEYTQGQVEDSPLYQDERFQGREYISLIYKKKPQRGVITVILRSKDNIDTFQSFLEEELDFRGNSLYIHIRSSLTACRRLKSNFSISLPYKGKNFSINPNYLYESRSNFYSSWLVPKEKDDFFRVGYPLGYIVEYESTYLNFNPFITVIRRNIVYTERYNLILLFSDKPIFLYNSPQMKQIGNSIIEEFQSTDMYGVQIRDYNRDYFDPANYTIILMTMDQFKLVMAVLLLLLLLTIFIYKKAKYGINTRFLSYLCILFLYILAVPVFFRAYPHPPSLNYFFCLQVFIITCLMLFLYLAFSKNISLNLGYIFAAIFLLSNYAHFCVKMTVSAYDYAIEHEILGPLMISITAFSLSILFYLYKEKKIEKIGIQLYQGIKTRIYGVPYLPVIFFCVLFFYLISTSPFIFRLGFSSVVFLIFLCQSYYRFSRFFKNEEYRKEKGCSLLNGRVKRVEAKENDKVFFYFGVFSEEVSNGEPMEQGTVIMYDNQLNYPVFGLSYDQVEENMKLLIIAEESNYEKREIPLQALFIKIGDQ